VDDGVLQDDGKRCAIIWCVGVCWCNCVGVCVLLMLCCVLHVVVVLCD
jgi:hypothetical protein